MDDSEANADPFTDADTFASDTAISLLDEGRWGATLRRGWWIVRGPNGGYLAAIVLRAILAEVDDPARRPRSVTLHYIAPPQAGPAEVHTTIERSGRSLTTVTARLIQAGEVKVLAMAAVATDRDAPEWSDLPAPDVPPADALAVSEEPSTVPLSARFDQRGLQGRPFAGEPRAQTMGWIRPAEPAPLDWCLIAALTDAWLPAVFVKHAGFAAVPTIDLTIHFRDPLPPGDTTGAWCLVRFTTDVSSSGYLEETGEVWSADGRLLAQSRQLAVFMPLDQAEG
ncbi:MAG: thioesterase family protein [Acidimicrobiales bacterium]